MTSKPLAMTHQQGLPAVSASRKKPGGSPKPLLKKDNAGLDPVKWWMDEIPVIGELVFSYSIYEERWRPYQVLERHTQECPIAKQPKWFVMNLDTGQRQWMLARYLQRAI